ncbi:MAG: aspartate carbamoyltransferase [Chloroflexota bacterium]|nr:MAG: aspartate carbamoyltransferase [Chloroflexota bacterium]
MVSLARPTQRESQDYTNLFQPQPIQGDFTGKHIVTVEQFERGDLEALFATASRIRNRVRSRDLSLNNICAGQVMATLFYEASTRTDMSFQAAMLRLGGEVIATSGGVQFSSVYKGENLADTVRAAGCYADVVVLRHPEVGSSYEAAYYLDRLSESLGRRTVLISGGDGIGEHPSQALLDLFTIMESKHNLDGLHIAMVGDLLYGRTVHSLSKLIAQYGAQNVTLYLVSPDSQQMPPSIIDYVEDRGVYTYATDNLNDVLDKADVIYWTRIQEERFADRADYDRIAGRFVMTPDVLAQAKPDAILMHPLPRKHEMGTPADHDILDADPRAVYFKQMEYGMFIRMALLASVLGAADRL